MPSLLSPLQHRRLFSRAWMALAMLSVLTVAGCGFQVRGFDLGLPFKSMAIQGEQGVANEIRQMIFGQPNLRVVQKPADAEVVLVIAAQNLDRFVTAFSSAGRPREIQLRMRVTYRVNDSLGVEITPLQEISLVRDLSVSDAEVLSLPSAEAFLQGDMQRDIARQIVRRLKATKPPS